jgi:hypothetical protein
MSFNGVVGDMGSSADSVVRYSLGYVGDSERALRKFVLAQAKKKGVTVESVSCVKQDDGRFKVEARVRSSKGVL